MPLNRPARSFAELKMSIDGGGRKPSLASKFDLLFCKIPGIKYLEKLEEFFYYEML